MSSGSVVGCLVVAQLLVEGFGTPLRWWLVVPVALVGGAVAGWRAARAGRVTRIRDEAIGHRELLLSAYEVRSPYDMSAPTSQYDAARFELRVTNRGLQMWDGTTQVWSHPWRTLRLTAEGKVLVIYHEGETIGRMLVRTPDGSPCELLLAARRLQARGAQAGRA
ncbi:hypothetical protein [Streptomyces sp. NPDC056190]|uniref:hypothetical protein n=1 Tax=unclassified Streptomyces TaxID=2593676 RepID=UPI0035D96C74